MENSEAEDAVMSFPVEPGNNDHWELESRVLSLATQTRHPAWPPQTKQNTLQRQAQFERGILRDATGRLLDTLRLGPGSDS